MKKTRDIFSVSRLNSELRQVLEGSFPLMWVAGEISNLSKPRSGHLYFSLKDRNAQIRCALFKGKRNLLRFEPKDGDQVVARVRVVLYEPRGDCQLIVEHMEAAGAGDLQAQFEQLKRKLQAEGLFDTERKLTLPSHPTTIGIITSPSGAAVQDILQVLSRRYSSTNVIIYPSVVQGPQAATELSQALSTALNRNECDLIILTRGGGSLEDLAAFNDETLARQIASATLPIVSAVGHEIDFTIADFVADRRAPTPSAAAELVSPDQEQLNNNVTSLKRRLQTAANKVIKQSRQQSTQLVERLRRQDPGHQVTQQQQQIDELELRLNRLIKSNLDQPLNRLLQWQQRLQVQNPSVKLKQHADQLEKNQVRLSNGIQHLLSAKKNQLESSMKQLHSISPLGTLERGYSITLDNKNEVVHDAKNLKQGDQLTVRLKKGSVKALVEKIDKAS